MTSERVFFTEPQLLQLVTGSHSRHARSMSQPETATRPSVIPALRPVGADRPVSPAETFTSEYALERLRGRLMRQSLSHLLDQAPGVRQALPHLAALESALDQQGPATLGGISRPVLVKLCSQLSGLPLPADDPPLHDLLERLMRALESAPLPASPVQRPLQMHDLSDFLTEDKLLVAEASYTDFAAASGELATTRPGKL
jgi:hypothetical protein